MVNNFAFGISEKAQILFEKWKYLLIQEKCRVCKRMIHPLIEKMDFEHYGPPAKYFIDSKEIISDVLCQFCLPYLASSQAVINAHEYEYNEELHELLVASAAVFKEPINGLILRLKYSDDVLLSKDLACVMCRAWEMLKDKLEDVNDPNSIIFVPVPLHKKRLHERGYNQVELLAKHLGDLLQIKVESKLLCRVKNTASQQELSKAERSINVVGAFAAVKENSFAGKQVILIDDVCTSGATLIECSKAVTAAGALAVYGLSIAYVP